MKLIAIATPIRPPPSILPGEAGSVCALRKECGEYFGTLRDIAGAMSLEQDEIHEVFADIVKVSASERTTHLCVLPSPKRYGAQVREALLTNM